MLGSSPSGSGTALIVFLAAATLGSFAAGRLMVATAHYKRVPLAGLVLGLIMLVAFALKPAGLSLIEVCALLTIGGAGLGVMYPVTTTIVQNTVRPQALGTATGALNFAASSAAPSSSRRSAPSCLAASAAGGHGSPSICCAAARVAPPISPNYSACSSPPPRVSCARR